MEPTQKTDSSILIAHLADSHLRDTQYATARRGIDFFEAFKAAVELACDKADVLVLVGDIFDRPRPSPRVIGQLMQIHQIISSKNKMCLATTGNHDWGEPTWLSILFPPGDSGGIVALDDRSVTFRGFEFTGVRQRNAGSFREDIAEIEKQARKSDVVLFHGLVDGVVPFFAGLQDPLRADELPVSKTNKAWLLGDIHIQGYTERSRPGGGMCLIGYPGSTEMCQAAEPKAKSVPLIRLTKESAVLEDRIPVPTRPYITGVIETEDDLDAFIREQAEPVASQHPVVSVKFNRELTQTIERLHSILDAQRAVIRCYPLPELKAHTARAVDDGIDEYGMEHFVSKRFASDAELGQVALDLLHRGEEDSNNIVSEFVERRLASTGVRED
jgi:DNA repair exonuclease SbcCD nuclease subunit